MVDPAILIDRASFSEDDRDNGTAGLCGMFALALYRAVLDQRPVLVLIGVERGGKPLKTRDGGYYWRHAAVKVGERYFDIDGEQKLEWMFHNYVWGVPHDTDPTVIEMSPADFVAEMHSTPSSWDHPFFELCSTKLKNSY